MRIERLMKRSSWNEGSNASEAVIEAEIRFTYVFGSNTIDFDTMTAWGTHGKIRLTDQEVRLLKIFIANRGKPLSRKVLLEVGWGIPRRDDTHSG